MEFVKRHDTTDTTGSCQPVPTCYGLVTDLLRGSYGETGVGLFLMDLGKLASGKLLTCCRLATDFSFMLRTCYRLVSDTMGN